MGKLYWECYSGISGDMVTGALLDLGAPEQELRKQLATLPLEGYTIEIKKEWKQGMAATFFHVYAEADPMVFSHEAHSKHGSAHTHTQGRTLPEIHGILEGSQLSPRAKQMAKEIFSILAQAEGEIHGQPADQVALQEVGAVDSIVDVAAAAVCVDLLGVDEILVSPLYEGSGFTHCSHGRTPVPAPATMRILQTAGLPLQITGTQGELVTPTGAAIAAALARPASQSFVVRKVGVGAGQKDFAHPNILRAMLVETEDCFEGDEVCVLRSAIDDSTPEILGYCQGLLLDSGALDVQFSPIYMKKNRPAYELTVLCRREDESAMTGIIFRETTAIGLRKSVERRNVMNREIAWISVDGIPVACKVCTYGNLRKYYVEYESAAQAAEKTGLPLEEIYRQAYGEIKKMQED